MCQWVQQALMAAAAAICPEDRPSGDIHDELQALDERVRAHCAELRRAARTATGASRERLGRTVWSCGLRLSNAVHTHNVEWADADLLLILRARQDAMIVEDWCPICLVVAMLKWYGRYMWQSLRRTLRPLPARVAGLSPGRQPMLLSASFMEPSAGPLHRCACGLRLRHAAEQLRARGAAAAQVAAVRPCSVSSSALGYSRESAMCAARGRRSKK